MKYILHLQFLLWAMLATSHSFAQSSDAVLRIGESTLLPSTYLKEERRINIVLPDGYDATAEINYPVIYILDGGMDEDFIHMAGLVRFNAQPWVGRVSPSIVVGIENTNRRRDFTHAVTNIDFIEKEGFKKEQFPQYGGSAAYLDFIEKELQPYIQQTYRTNGTSTIIGESLAGLLSTEVLLKRPYLFDNYVIISPSLWWGEQELLQHSEQLLTKQVKKPVHVYIGAPSKAEDLKMYQEVESLFNRIKAVDKVSVTFDYLEDETHATVSHQAVYNAFKALQRQAETAK